MADNFLKEVKKIIKKDRRYEMDAYSFVMESLHFHNQKHDIKSGQHITARELLQGAKEYADLSFGPMAKFTLSSWGVCSTKDIGHIVYNLIETGFMGKTEEDSLEDFFDVFDFDSVFKEDIQAEVREEQKNG